MRLERITAFRLVTQDPERLARFYAALGLETGEERSIDPAELHLLGVGGKGMRRPLRIGAMRVDLDCLDPPGRPYPVAATAAATIFQHLALVTSDVSASWDKARAAGATPISRDGPVTLPASSGGVTAIKFRDPEGHPLELIRFPDGSANGWTGEGLLGIDHSAIVARDVAVSRAFYAASGLTETAATLNQGPTQARLDGLDGALVDVVPMMPRRPTPHIELLHYRAPPAPSAPPSAVNDMAATRIVWRGDGPALSRDPDGHLNQIEG